MLRESKEARIFASSVEITNGDKITKTRQVHISYSVKSKKGGKGTRTIRIAVKE